MLSQHSQYMVFYYFFCPFILHLTPFLNIETPFKHQKAQLNWNIPAIIQILYILQTFWNIQQYFHIIHIFIALFKVLQSAMCIWHQLFNNQPSQLQVIPNLSSPVKHVIPKPWTLIDWLQGFYSIQTEKRQWGPKLILTDKFWLSLRSSSLQRCWMGFEVSLWKSNFVHGVMFKQERYFYQDVANTLLQTILLQLSTKVEHIVHDWLLTSEPLLFPM